MKVKDEFVNSKKILVFNPSFIGDAILTTPLINALIKLFPQATVDFCIRPESAPLFKNTYNTVIFDKRKNKKGLKGLLSLAKIIKNNKYDFAISVHKSFRSILTLKYAGIKIIGFNESALKYFINKKIPRNMHLHEIERNLSLLSCLTDNFSLDEAKCLGGKPYTYLDEKYLLECKKQLNINKKTVGINAGSVWPTKRWPIEYFAELVEKIKNDYNIILIGGPTDEIVYSELKKTLLKNNIKFIDYVNTVEFSKIPAVIKSCDVLITNDSAPMHIAVSQEIPCVAIFGPTVPELGFSPYDNISKICQIDLSCRPCGLHGNIKCPKIHFKCMKDLKVEYVYNTFREVISENLNYQI